MKKLSCFLYCNLSLVGYSEPGELQFIGALFLVDFNFYCFLSAKLQVFPIKAKKKTLQNSTKFTLRVIC